jgi:phosphoglycerate dehydrogenase-like enzyme
MSSLQPALLISQKVIGEFRPRLTRILAQAPRRIELLPYVRDVVFTPAQVESVEIAYYSRDIWEGTTRTTLSPAAAGFWNIVDRAPQPKWTHVFSSGTDQPRYQQIRERGARLTTSAGAQAEPVAHAAVTGLLALARRFPHYFAAQSRGEWAPLQATDVPDLRGQTAIIIGTGHIGSVIARCLQAFGVWTVGIRRSLTPTPHFDEVITLAHLDERLPTCDWLVLACPLVADTHGLIDARRLALLPKSAGLVNVARGEIVDEAALARALAERALMGAFLDVFLVEPLPKDSPLWKLPNAVVSPHNAGASSGTYARGVEVFLRNLERYLRNEPMENEAQR